MVEVSAHLNKHIKSQSNKVHLRQNKSLKEAKKIDKYTVKMCT